MAQKTITPYSGPTTHSGAVRSNTTRRLTAKKTSVAVSATVKCMASPIAAMPAPASIAGRPQSAEATPRRTSGGVRPACIQAWTHAAAMSSTPQSSQPVRIACPVPTAGTDAVDRTASDWRATRSQSLPRVAG